MAKYNDVKLSIYMCLTIEFDEDYKCNPRPINRDNYFIRKKAVKQLIELLYIELEDYEEEIKKIIRYQRGKSVPLMRFFGNKYYEYKNVCDLLIKLYYLYKEEFELNYNMDRSIDFMDFIVT